LAGKFVVPVGFVIDRGHRLANQCSAVLRTSAFTVRAHCALALPITASGAIASSTIHQNCRSMLGYRRDERRNFIRSRGSQRHQIQ
jgi:hypothetical protein